MLYIKNSFMLLFYDKGVCGQMQVCMHISSDKMKFRSTVILVIPERKLCDKLLF